MTPVTSTATVTSCEQFTTSRPTNIETLLCAQCLVPNMVDRLYLPVLAEQHRPFHCWNCTEPINLSILPREPIPTDHGLTPNGRDLLAAMPTGTENAQTAQQLADTVACAHGTARNLLAPSGTLRQHYGVLLAPGGGYYRQHSFTITPMTSA